MGDFGLGAGYDPVFTGDPTTDGTGVSTLDSGLTNPMITPDYSNVDASQGATLPGEDLAAGVNADNPGGVASGFGDGGVGMLFGGGGGYSIMPGLSRLASSFSIGGSQGLQYTGGGGGAIVPRPARGGGAAAGYKAQAKERVRAIIGTISAHLGRGVSLTASLSYIRKWGMPAASAAFGVGGDDLTFLLAAGTLARSRRGSRGPHLHTIVKRIKRGDHYRHMLRKWASKAGIHRSSGGRSGPTHHRSHHRRRRAGKR